MKYLLILLFSIASYSQNVYISTGFDLKNMIVGSAATQNKPEFDLIFRFGMIGGKTEINVGYERFNAISFDRFFFGAGHHFPLYAYVFGKEVKTTLIPMIEPTLIGRWGETWQTRSSHLSIGASLSLRYEVTNKITFELQTNALPRTDLFARYREIHSSVPIIFSNYFSVLYKI